MRKILLMLVVTIVLVSCSKSVDFTSLQFKFGVAYEINSDKPYTGEALIYYSNGEVLERQNYKKGILNGELINYYNNGKLKMKSQIKNGSPNGKSIVYYENGSIEGKGEYKDGRKVGEWILYNKNGDIIARKKL